MHQAESANPKNTRNFYRVFDESGYIDTDRRWVEGDEAAIPPSAKRGFAVFTGKAGCSACHSGWRFTDDKFHDIGTTTTDLGRGGAVKDESLNFAFKTPTLRSVALRAPYMHLSLIHI